MDEFNCKCGDELGPSDEFVCVNCRLIQEASAERAAVQRYKDKLRERLTEALEHELRLCHPDFEPMEVFRFQHAIAANNYKFVITLLDEIDKE